MFIFLILGLLIGALTVVFALQNLGTVSVLFLAWQMQGSLCLILLLALLSGFLVCMLFSLPEALETSETIAKLKLQNKSLQDENDNYKKIINNIATTPTIQ